LLIVNGKIAGCVIKLSHVMYYCSVASITAAKSRATTLGSDTVCDFCVGCMTITVRESFHISQRFEIL
jgi:hypothetical protein